MADTDNAVQAEFAARVALEAATHWQQRAARAESKLTAISVLLSTWRELHREQPGRAMVQAPATLVKLARIVEAEPCAQ